MARPATATEGAVRRQTVARMYLEGHPQHAIAAAVKCAQPTVARDLSVLRGEWLKSSVRDYNARKAEELARIDYLESEAWAAWHRSKEPAETKAMTSTPVKDKETGRTRLKPTETSRKQVGQTGSAEYLKTVQWCVEQRCKILGLDAPKQFNVLSVGLSVTAELPPPPNLSADDLILLADLAVRAGTLDGPARPPGTPEAPRVPAPPAGRVE